ESILEVSRYPFGQSSFLLIEIERAGLHELRLSFASLLVVRDEVSAIALILRGPFSLRGLEQDVESVKAFGNIGLRVCCLAGIVVVFGTWLIRIGVMKLVHDFRIKIVEGSLFVYLCL